MILKLIIGVSLFLAVCYYVFQVYMPAILKKSKKEKVDLIDLYIEDSDNLKKTKEQIEEKLTKYNQSKQNY